MDKKKSVKKQKVKGEFKASKRKAEAIFSFLDTVVDSRGTSFEFPKASITANLLQSSSLPSSLEGINSVVHSAQFAIPNYSCDALASIGTSVNYAQSVLANPAYNIVANDSLFIASAFQPSANSLWIKSAGDFNNASADSVFASIHQPWAKYSSDFNSYSTIIGNCNSISNSCRSILSSVGEANKDYIISNKPYDSARYDDNLRVCVDTNVHAYLDDVVYSSLRNFESHSPKVVYEDLSSFKEENFTGECVKSFSAIDLVGRITSEGLISFQKYLDEYYISNYYYEAFQTRIEEAKIYFGDGKVVKYLRKLFKKLLGIAQKIYTLSWSCRSIDLRNIIRKRIKNFHSCIGEEDELEYSISKHEKYSIHLQFIYTNEKRNYRTAC